MSAVVERTNRIAESGVSVWPELRRALRPHSRRLLLAAATAATAAVTEVLIIALVAAFTERLIAESSSVPFLSQLSDGALTITTMVAVTAKVLLDLTAARVNSNALQRFEGQVRRDVAILQARTKWTVIEDSEPGALHSLMWNSTAHARNAFAQVLSLVSSICSLLLMVAATVISAGPLAVAGVIGLVLFGLLFRPLTRAAKKAGLHLKTSLRTYGARLNEDIQMSREIRVLGAQEELAQRLAADGEDLGRAVARQLYLNAVLSSGYSNAVYALALFGFIVIGATGTAAPAPLAALVLLLYRSLAYGRSVQSSLQGLAATAPFVADVNHWIDRLRENAESTSGAQLTSTFQEISFRAVGLIYPNGTTGLKSVDVELSAKEAVAVVGPSGSGKSSFVSLILALRDATDGEIRINGITLADVDKVSWRRRVSLVPQESLLFDTTVEDNVRCWRQGISHERIVEALQQAHVLDEVMAMPLGLDTRVGEGGRRLSGGQRQRICLARALAGDPEVLVLDEPTSALDAASELAVQRSLEALKGRITLVIVAHRVSTIRSCDRVLVFDGGRLTHDADAVTAVKESEFFASVIAINERV